MDQNKFKKTVREFQELEDARDQLWDRAQTLIKKGFEIDAYILILATWNFARFRYFMKKFNLQKFAGVIKQVNPKFKKLEKVRFENIDFSNKALLSDIKFIYTQIKTIAEQTGASKIMALKNSNLFIMWDTEIRRIYKINNKGTAEDYIDFLIKMHDAFGKIKWSNKKRPLAKVIDEYNYVVADKNRSARKKKKQQNGR